MQKKVLNVLFVTNMYPDDSHPNLGIFVKEQIELLSRELESFGLINMSKPKNWLVKYGLTLPSVLRRILSRRYNIIHVHFGLTAVVIIPFILLIRLFRIRTVITFHGTDVVGKNRLGTAISKFAASCLDLSICVSDDIQKIISKYSKHAVKISCGISEEFFDDRPKIERQKLIIFPSDPDRKEKNFQLFKRTLDRVQQHIPEVSFICLKNLTKNEVIEHMNRAKCLLMTSLYEGSPQTVKEAIICDLPVVSTPAGDVPNLLKDLPGCAIGKNEDELVEAVLAIFNTVEDYHYPKDVKRKFSNFETCNRIIHCYNQLMN